MITQDIINDILSKADIVSIISNYISVIKKGNSYVAVCPFHNDKNPSLMISQTKQIYKCFACKSGGNVFTFVSEYEKIPFIAAVKRVAQLINYNSPLLQDNERKVDNKTKSILKALSDSSNFYHYVLSTKAGIEGAEYLEKRNISEDMISYFKLGFSPRNSETTIKLLRQKGNEIESLDEAGISLHVGTKFLDRFEGRIIFPIYNEYSEVIGFSGRRIVNSDEAKYVNSPSTKLFNKSSVLYNYQNAKNESKREGYCYVVEGFMDVFSLYRVGIKSCVALMGTAFTSQHAKMLKHLNCEIRLMLDGDNAGQHGMITMCELLDKENIAYRFVDYHGEVLDPDEIFNQKGKDELVKLANNLVQKSKFVLDYYQKECDITTVEGKKDYVVKVAKHFVNNEIDNLQKEAIIKEISQVIGLSASSIGSAFNYIVRGKVVEKNDDVQFTIKRPIRESKLKRTQRQLIYCMMNNTDARQFVNEVPIVIFVDDIYNLIANYINELSLADPMFKISQLISFVQSNGDNKNIINEIIGISEDESLSKDCSQEAINEVINITQSEINNKLFKEQFFGDIFAKDEIQRARMLDDKNKRSI